MKNVKNLLSHFSYFLDTIHLIILFHSHAIEGPLAELKTLVNYAALNIVCTGTFYLNDLVGCILSFNGQEQLLLMGCKKHVKTRKDSQFLTVFHSYVNCSLASRSKNKNKSFGWTIYIFYQLF